MAQHNIKLSLKHPLPIGNVDAEFEVREGRQLLGHVKISRGGIDWHPAHKRRSVKARWAAFADWMENGC